MSLLKTFLGLKQPDSSPDPQAQPHSAGTERQGAPQQSSNPEDGPPSNYGTQDLPTRSTRTYFIRRVFLILTVQMLVTLALAATLASLKNEHQVWKRNGYVRALCECLAYTSASILIFFEQMRLKHPLNLIPLSITTLWASCLMGIDVSILNTETILIALGATAVIYFAVTIVSIKAPCDSTAGLKVLLGCLMLLLILGRLERFTQPRQLNTMLVMLLFLRFSLLIWSLVTSTQMLRGGMKRDFSPDDSVLAALVQYYLLIFLLDDILSITDILLFLLGKI